MSRSRAMGLGLMVLVLLTTACTSVLGVTDLPSDTCGGATATNACQLCLTGACCSQLTACADDPSCAALSTCATACNGASRCLDDCAAQYPSTVVDEYNAPIDCAESSCASDCQ